MVKTGGEPERENLPDLSGQASKEQCKSQSNNETLEEKSYGRVWFVGSAIVRFSYDNWSLR